LLNHLLEVNFGAVKLNNDNRLLPLHVQSTHTMSITIIRRICPSA